MSKRNQKIMSTSRMKIVDPKLEHQEILLNSVKSYIGISKFIFNFGVLIKIKYNDVDNNILTIPEGCIAIGPTVFVRNRIEMVIIPETCSVIHKYAFFQCMNLKCVQIKCRYPIKVKRLAFYLCSQLQSVDIKYGSSISKNAFPKDTTLNYTSPPPVLCTWAVSNTKDGTPLTLTYMKYIIRNIASYI